MDSLMKSDLSLLIVDFQKASRVTVGVPHHTPAGKSFMPTPRKRPGDENAGFIGRVLADELGASFVCACNYFLDPNKSLETDYSRAIIRSNPRVLIEIHGHGQYNTENDIEISCGSRKEEVFAVQLMEKLQEKLGQEDIPLALQELKIEARFDKIYFQATQAATIKKSPWRAYHIELPQLLRVSSGDPGVPTVGEVFAGILGKAFREITTREEK